MILASGPTRGRSARSRAAYRRLAAALCVAGLALFLAVAQPGVAAPNGQPANVPTAGTPGVNDVGQTPDVPAAVETGGPAPAQTGNPGPVQTGGPAGAPGGGGTGATGAVDSGVPAPAAQASASLLPWLIGALVLAALAAAAVYILRRGGSAAPAPALATAGVAAARVPAATSAEVRCPNCDALNPADRRFCDECGQALNPAPAAAAAGGAAVPAVDEATLPYLETLSRVDDQLEFVLARDVVTIGREPDSDIVIDDQFVDWQSVSPRHARLSRQGDGFVVEDLGSENGTFINGVRTGQNLLEDGMTIGLGKVEFVYRVPQV